MRLAHKWGGMMHMSVEYHNLKISIDNYFISIYHLYQDILYIDMKGGFQIGF